MDNEKLLKNIKYLCKIKNITQKKLYQEINITNQFAGNLKKGKKPNIETIEKIADYFNVSIDYLIGRTENTEINE